MDQTSDSQPVVERLQDVRAALESGRFEKALQELIAVRESGVLEETRLDKSTVGDKVDRLRKEPGEETASELEAWVADALDRVGEETVEAADSAADGRAESRPDSDPFGHLEEVSGAGDEISAQDALSMSEDSDVGVELKDLSEADEDGGGGSRATGFSRDEQPATAISHASLPGESEGDDEQVMEGGDDDFDRLPSVEMEVDEESSLEEDDDLEPFESEEAEADHSEDEGGVSEELEAFDPDELTADDADVEGSEGDGADNLFEPEPTSRDSASNDVDSGAVEDEQVAADDDLDSAEEFEFDSVSSAEWSALAAFESSELDADSSDFEFDDEEGGEAEAEPAAEPSAEPQADADESFGEAGESDDEFLEAAADGDDDFDLDFDFEDDDSEDEEVVADGGSLEADPNKTQQPFDNAEDAAEYAGASLDADESQPTDADSIEELVGEDNADLLRGDSGDGADVGEGGFERGGATAKNDAPEPGDSPAPDTGGFENDAPTAKTDAPASGETEESDEFDLGFENPGADDAAGFMFDEDENDQEMSEPSSAETPVPDQAPSPDSGQTGPAQTPMPENPPSPEPVEDSAVETPMPEASHDEVEQPETGEVEQPDPDALESMDSPSDGTRQAFNPFAAESEESGGDQPSTSGTEATESDGGARYTAEAASDAAEQDAASAAQGEERVMTPEGGVEKPLSDEEFFELADELSDGESESDAMEESSDGATPTPHRGEPVVPTGEGSAGSSGVSAPSSGSGPESMAGAGISEPTSAANQSSGGGAGVHGTYSQVSHDSSEADEESRELAAGAVQLIEQAEELFEKGNLESAHDLIQSVLEGNPDSDRAQQLLERIEQEYSGLDRDEETGSENRETVESSQPPPMDAVPEREVAMSEVADRDFDHRFGFILSLVDGTVTVQDILELSSMPRQETLSVLGSMIEQSVISIDR